MSANKYANLPDIDTAPDVYETEDTLPDAAVQTSEEHEEDYLGANRRAQNISNVEDINSSSLDTEHAFDKFKRAERHSKGVYYAYPPSPSSSSTFRSLPLPQRLAQLQASLVELEDELADPSNPELQSLGGQSSTQGEVDAGDLIRGLADVRARLEKVKKGRDGTSKLISTLMANSEIEVSEDGEQAKKEDTKKEDKSDMRNLVSLDKRLGELEHIVGSSDAALDEVGPLPQPLLPLLTRLNGQLTLLTQPRHAESISRRLKLLLSDLDRVAASQKQTQKDGQRNQNVSNTAAPLPTQLSEQLLPLLTRLGPALPHISHVLAKLRTLSVLHTHASEFHESLESMEEEQKSLRKGLKELSEAVQTVEESLETNKSVVKGNVEGLEDRIEALMKRLEVLDQ